MFDSTAAVELVGPCDFELVDHNSARLHRGLVYADVPGRATGFAVHTPGGLSIVDLGTRFSVEITETGTRVDTLEGAVQLRRGNQTLTTVTAGQAVMYRDEALTALPAARGPLERRVHFGFAPGDAMGWRLHRGGALVEPDDQSFGDGGSPNLLAIDGKVTYADGRPPMPPAAGDGLLGSMPFERRDEHHPTLVMRSPAFVLEPGGAIELKLLGGSGGAESPPQRDSDLSVESKPEGFMGVALRRERDGRYLAALRRTEPGEDKAGWQTLRWDAEMLVALGADREVLTLDLIDAYEGDWGWIALDEVIIDGGLAEAQAP
jgi:hypothetical protein